MNVKSTYTHLLTRQPLSPLGKIATWGFLVATIAGIGLNILLAILAGAPSRDSIIASVLCDYEVVRSHDVWNASA